MYAQSIRGISGIVTGMQFAMLLTGEQLVLLPGQTAWLGSVLAAAYIYKPGCR
jgi:hypothetical protein